MAYRIASRKLKPRHAAAVKLTARPSEFASAFELALAEVTRHLEAVGVAPAGPPFARYFDFSEEAAEMEVGFPVEKTVPPGDRVEPVELPGGLAAITVHSGPYESLEQAHDAIGQWVLAGGHDPAGPVWEVYRTDPRLERDQSRWETEVVWPLRR